METIQTDLAIIGSGPGGYVAAIRAAKLGLKVLLIEKESLGGVCLNQGCIPSKALIHVADLYDQMKNASKLGINIDNATIDFEKVMAFKSKVVKKLNMGVEKLVTGNGATILQGQGRFVDSNTLEVKCADKTVRVETGKSIIAVGASPVELPFMPFDGQTVVSSKEVLSFSSIPDRMIVIGGGVIGAELGQAYAKFGTKVTIVEMLDRLLPSIPENLVDPVLKKFKRQRITVHARAKAEKLSVENGVATVSVKLQDGSQIELEAEKVLVSTGLKPNSGNLGLENTKVKLDDKGFIETAPGIFKTDDDAIFAIGDVAGEPLLAHKASAQGIVAAEKAAGRDASLSGSTVPYVVYTDPEIACVGLSESQAAKLNRMLSIGEYPLAGHGRANTMDKPDGFVKVIAEAATHTVLGVQIVGANAGELIGEAVLALQNLLRVEDLGTMIHPHPTLSEALSEAADDALNRAIHKMPQ